jgi:hypothetical protein
MPFFFLFLLFHLSFEHQVELFFLFLLVFELLLEFLLIFCSFRRFPLFFCDSLPFFKFFLFFRFFEPLKGVSTGELVPEEVGLLHVLDVLLLRDPLIAEVELDGDYFLLFGRMRIVLR